MKIIRRIVTKTAVLKESVKPGGLLFFISFAVLVSGCGDPRFIDGDELSPRTRSESSESKSGEDSSQPVEVPRPTHEGGRSPDLPAHPGNSHSKKGGLNPEKSTVEILECHFAKSIGTGKGPDKGPGNGKGEKTLRCSAFAKIHAKKTHSDPTVMHPKPGKPGPGTDDGTKVHPDRLTVLCGGDEVFSGEVTHTVMTENELLIGNLRTDDHPLIVLSFPLSHPNTEPRSLDSSLTIGDIQLAGTCDKMDETGI